MAVAMIIGLVFSMVLQFAVPVLGPLLVPDLGITRAQLGSVTMVFFLVGALSSPRAGRWCDSVGGRTSMLASIVLGSAGLMVAGLANGLAVLLLGALVAGVAAAMGNPATNRIVMRGYDDRTRGAVIGLKQSGVQFGALLSGALLPTLALATGWRTALLISGGVGLASVLVAAVLVPRDLDPGTRPSPDDVRPTATPTLWTLCLFAMLMGFGIACVNTYLPIYAVESVGESVARAGLVASVLGGCGIGARLLWGLVADRLANPLRLLPVLATGAATGVGLVLSATTVGPLTLWVGAALLGMTALGWHGVVMLLAMRTVPEHRAGWASGRVVLWFYGGFMISPVPFGALADATGSYRPGWTGILGAFALAAVLTGTRAWRAERTERSLA